MARSIFRTSLLVCLAVMAFCSKDYNPFDDLTNAKAQVLSWSFASTSPVQVYSTGTLVIGVAAREEVDSFCLHAASNRFWQDTMVGRGKDIIAASPFSFSVSFFDTGVQTVTVNTWRTNGEKVSENLSVRVVLPLSQVGVTGYFGDSVRLSTPPVDDKDVYYQWNFGPGRVVKSTVRTATAVFAGGNAAGPGTLYVTDLAGSHSTPPIAFSFSLFDTSCPIILCVNDSLHADTIVTRDNLLAFRAYIANYGDVAVDSCSVNGSAFDFSNSTTHIYTRIFTSMAGFSRSKGPLRITVRALDYSDPRRTLSRSFWAVFDPLGPSSPEADIAFVIPSKDSSTTATRDFRVFGSANNFRNDSMVLRVTVNDSAYATPCVIGSGSGVWEWPVHLNSYVNLITVTGSGASDKRKLASAHVTVVFDPTKQDTIKPMIWGIAVDSADGKPDRAVYTQQASVTLRVTAFDEGSGIQTLTINNTAMTPDSSGYRWLRTMGPLAHSASGDTVVVRAVDKNQNVQDASIVIYRNTKPVVGPGFTIPPSLCVDSAYSLHISTFDADNDPVRVDTVSVPSGMIVSSDGVISWTPRAANVGTDTLKVRLYDGFQYAPIAWAFNCVMCSKPVQTVRFTTKEKDFPTVLQAGVDTLRIMLRADSAGAGVVLRYTAAFTDRSEVIAASDTSPLIVWAPQAGDTGVRRLSVTVGNGTAVYDSISPAISVVARNQFPCSLTHTFTGDTTPSGELDLFTHQKPETLFFAIVDLDNPLTETYTVTIARHSVNSIETLNKKDFFIVLAPDSTRVTDTIRVVITDATKTSDKAAFVVRYSALTPYPSWTYSRSLVLNTASTGAAVAGDVHDFPVLVRLTSSNFNFSQAAPNGEDIRFAKPSGAPCSYQIDRWIPAQGVAELWVKVDTVYGNNPTQSITMFWGASTGSATVSLSNGAAVFDTSDGFQAVWHLSGAGTDPVLDATGNHYNGVPTSLSSGAMTQGLVGQCQRFNGTSSFVAMPGTAASKLNFPEQGIYSVSAWVNTVALDGQFHTIASKGDMQYNLQIRSQSNEWQFSECRAATGYAVVRSPASAGSWNLITGVRKGDRQYLYVNGVCTDSIIEITIGGTGRSTASDFVLGKMPEAVGYFFNGMIDEVRVSSTPLSADWNKLCYMNQKQADALVVFK